MPCTSSEIVSVDFFCDNHISNMNNAAETSHAWSHIWHSSIQAAGEGVWETDKGERIEGQFQNHTVLHLFYWDQFYAYI